MCSACVAQRLLVLPVVVRHVFGRHLSCFPAPPSPPPPHQKPPSTLFCHTICRSYAARGCPHRPASCMFLSTHRNAGASCICSPRTFIPSALYGNASSYRPMSGDQPACAWANHQYLGFRVFLTDILPTEFAQRSCKCPGW